MQHIHGNYSSALVRVCYSYVNVFQMCAYTFWLQIYDALKLSSLTRYYIY